MVLIILYLLYTYDFILCFRNYVNDEVLPVTREVSDLEKFVASIQKRFESICRSQQIVKCLIEPLSLHLNTEENEHLLRKFAEPDTNLKEVLTKVRDSFITCLYTSCASFEVTF